MSLHTSENVRCFFKCERLDFSIFWHHQGQSPDLTSGYVLKLTSNHKFSINHAVNWNLGFGSVETFRSFFQNNLNIFWLFFIFWTFLYDWKWHYDKIDLRFFCHFKTTSVCDRKIPEKKQVETQSREMFLIFRTTPLVVRCISAASLVATALYFIQSKRCFSINWFNLAKMAWAVEQTPTLRQHNSTVVFVSWLATLQHRASWTYCELSVVPSR